MDRQPEQGIGNLAPQRGPELRQAFTAARRSKRAISESCSVVGIASGGKGPVRSAVVLLLEEPGL